MARIDARLDQADRAFLDRWLGQRGETLTEWIRAKVAEERDKDGLCRRMAAAQRLFAMEVEWIPEDPAELDRTLNEQDSPVDDSWQPS